MIRLARNHLCWLGTVAIMLCGCTVATAAAPTIEKLSLRGLQSGATTTLVIEGSDLGDHPQLVFPVPIAAQEIKPSSTDDRLEVDVKLAADVAPGIYYLRVATSQGISNPQLVAVDQLAQRPFGPQAGELPVALHGALAGGTILRTEFEGRKSQPIVVDLESRRIGGNLNPVIKLFDARQQQLAWAQRMPALKGDARLQLVLPADGRYTIELHDMLYRGEAPGTFRLKIGELAYADLIYPLGARRGAKRTFTLLASNQASGQTVTGDFSDGVDSQPLAWPSGPLFTGLQPQAIVSDFAEIVEGADDAQATPITLPVAINGRLQKPREEDSYTISVAPREKLRFTMIAAERGSPVDGVLSVRKESGEQLAMADDGMNTTDPQLEFAVPDGVDKLVVAVKDLLDRGGPDFVYRLDIARADTPDFSLELVADREQIPTGGAELIRVRAKRAGYDGPIKLAMHGLPPGIALDGTEIPAGATETLMTLAGSGTPAHGIAKIIGTSTDPNTPITRAALTGETAATKPQAYLRGEVAVAVTSKSPLSISWEPDSVATQLPLGGRLPAHVKITRTPFAAGAVKLELVSSQPTPKKAPAKSKSKTKRNPRNEEAERKLRFDGAPTIEADMTEATAMMIVPPDLPEIPYDVAIRANLLDAKKKVVATAITPARRLSIAQPFRIELVGEPRVNAAAGTGATGQITGKIIRVGEFPYPISVTLNGLPDDFLPPAVEVPVGVSDFTIPVSLPFNTPPGEIPNVSVVATADPDERATLRSNEAPVAVHVVPGGPPPALYRLFEDESHFVTVLNEGDGKAEVDDVDRYSGTAALRVTTVQKLRAKLPGLGVKIAEKPGEGEYRYLRYAWKKIGGGTVLLQLNANGAWGPQRGQDGPSFRYEAGPAPNSLQVAALKVGDRLPYGWTVVTRDLYADFGSFVLDGLALTPGDGEAALFDHLYLARSLDDFDACPAALPAETPLAVFEDQPEFVASMNQGDGTVTLVNDDKLSGSSSVKVTPEQRYNASLPGLQVKIRQNPGPGEYRYLQFAWKKQGGERVCLQLNHDGQWGPVRQPQSFRYDAGVSEEESFGAAMRVQKKLPTDWIVVTRDMYADFGEFTLSGLSLSPIDGEFALFDHIYLGRALRDFDSTP